MGSRFTLFVLYPEAVSVYNRYSMTSISKPIAPVMLAQGSEILTTEVNFVVDLEVIFRVEPVKM